MHCFPYIRVTLKKCYQNNVSYFVYGFSFSFSWCNCFFSKWNLRKIPIDENSQTVNLMVQLLPFLELPPREKLRAQCERACQPVHRKGDKVLDPFFEVTLTFGKQWEHAVLYDAFRSKYESLKLSIF